MALQDLIPVLFDNYFIKVIFLVHGGLFSLATVVNNQKGSQLAYISYNFILLMIILLAILIDKNSDATLVASLFNVVCLILDIVLLVDAGYIGGFTTLVIIVNLVLRIPSSILLLKNYSVRAGVEDPTGGIIEVSVAPSAQRTRSAYQNIDEPNQALP